MDKVLVILPEDNKGKFIAKGYSEAFSGLSYFVIEKKIYDLNLKEVDKISPNIIFCFWSNLSQKELLADFFGNIDNKKICCIHIGELSENIPNEVRKGGYCYSVDSKSKKYKIPQLINPKDYKTTFSGYKYSITFAGNPAYPEREKILSLLIYKYGCINIFCRSYDFYKSADEIYKSKLLDDEFLEYYKKSYRGYVQTPQELANIYNSSKINIDINADNSKKINYRVLEISASGGFVIANKSNELLSCFEDGKEIETFTDFPQLTDKIDFYLKNMNIAYLIAINAKKNVVSNYSFYDRLKSMLKGIYGKNFSN